MRWKSKQMAIEHNDLRILKRFAWFPVMLSDLTIVWFKRYEVLQMYVVTETPATIEGYEYTFKNGTWLNLSKKCK